MSGRVRTVAIERLVLEGVEPGSNRVARLRNLIADEVAREVGAGSPDPGGAASTPAAARGELSPDARPDAALARDVGRAVASAVAGGGGHAVNARRGRA